MSLENFLRVAAVVVIKWCNENMEQAEVMMMLCLMVFKTKDYLKLKTTNMEWSKYLTKSNLAHQS